MVNQSFGKARNVIREEKRARGQKTGGEIPTSEQSQQPEMTVSVSRPAFIAGTVKADVRKGEATFTPARGGTGKRDISQEEARLGKNNLESKQIIIEGQSQPSQQQLSDRGLTRRTIVDQTGRSALSLLHGGETFTDVKKAQFLKESARAREKSELRATRTAPDFGITESQLRPARTQTISTITGGSGEERAQFLRDTQPTPTLDTLQESPITQAALFYGTGVGTGTAIKVVGTFPKVQALTTSVGARIASSKLGTPLAMKGAKVGAQIATGGLVGIQAGGTAVEVARTEGIPAGFSRGVEEVFIVSAFQKGLGEPLARPAIRGQSEELISIKTGRIEKPTTKAEITVSEDAKVLKEINLESTKISFGEPIELRFTGKQLEDLRKSGALFETKPAREGAKALGEKDIAIFKGVKVQSLLIIPESATPITKGVAVGLKPIDIIQKTSFRDSLKDIGRKSIEKAKISYGKAVMPVKATPTRPMGIDVLQAPNFKAPELKAPEATVGSAEKARVRLSRIKLPSIKMAEATMYGQRITTPSTPSTEARSGSQRLMQQIEAEAQPQVVSSQSVVLRGQITEPAIEPPPSFGAIPQPKAPKQQPFSKFAEPKFEIELKMRQRQPEIQISRDITSQISTQRFDQIPDIMPFQTPRPPGQIPDIGFDMRQIPDITTTTIPATTTRTIPDIMPKPPRGPPNFLKFPTFLPPPDRISGGGFGRYKMAFPKLPKTPKQYTPSLKALALNIRGRKPSQLTGIEVRPILSQRRRKR